MAIMPRRIGGYVATGYRTVAHTRYDKDNTTALRALGPVIYAVRTQDGLIKIGHTKDFSARVRHFGGLDCVLGWRAGTLGEEQMLHAYLSKVVARGAEYYPWHPLVVGVVNSMRRDLGMGPLTRRDMRAA